MRQPIADFTLDDAGDWVALLGCGHRQHVRHRPPFIQRPWVVTPEGRARHLGTQLECLKCDRGEPRDFDPDEGRARGGRPPGARDSLERT